MEQCYLQPVDRDSSISWAAYHANQQPTMERHPAITAMLPLFQDDSKSFDMIRHSMDVVKQCVQQLNPSQVPVVTMDQPLYTRSRYSGTAHRDGRTEGYRRLAGRRWMGGAIVQAKAASPGTAESFLKASHVTRTRHTHQVTASSLYI